MALGNYRDALYETGDQQPTNYKKSGHSSSQRAQVHCSSEQEHNDQAPSYSYYKVVKLAKGKLGAADVDTSESHDAIVGAETAPLFTGCLYSWPKVPSIAARSLYELWLDAPQNELSRRSNLTM
jgi:hypothetical protein